MTGQALIYCRISADPEGRAVGVERQEKDCRELADRHGFTVAGVYVDNDVSASTNSTKPRPKYAELVARVKSGDIAAVLAYSNSRLTRRPLELEDVLELHRNTGVRVATVVSGEDNLATADGRMVARFKAVADAAEAERTAERVRRAKRANVEKGTYRGGPRPLGYEADGVTIRAHEARAIREAAQAVLEGMSLGRIAADWEKRGIVSTRSRRAIPPVEVGRYLKRARNAGLLDHKGALSPAVWPAIIDRETWEAVCAVLADPARRTNQTNSRPRWLLTGIAVCGVCGQTVSHGVTRGQPNYRCKGRACTIRRQDYTDQVLNGIVVERLSRPDAVTLLHTVNPEALEEAEGLRGKVRALSARLDALAADTSLSERMLAKRAEVLEAELDAASSRLDALVSSTSTAEPLEKMLTTRDPAAAYVSADLETQRAVVDLLMKVTFLPGKKGRPSGWKPGDPYFDPESIQIAWKSDSESR